MRIYTSYFANGKALKSAGICMVGIALYPPRWFGGRSIRSVAPTRSILKDTRTDEEYTRRYESEILPNVDFTRFVGELERISGGSDVALCCYERPSEFCHRQLLAKAMNAIGYNVEEWKPVEDRDAERQMSLDFSE